MKKHVFLCMWLLSGWVLAQNRQIIATSSGEDLGEKVSTHLQYLFPDFTEGDVYFMKTPKGNGKLNYNMLADEMQFVDNDEVMALANVRDVAMVSINNRTFYPFNNKEFTEELLATDKLRLRVRCKGVIAEYSKNSAYGTQSSTSAITSYSSVNQDGRQYSLTVATNVLISLKYYYYLVGTNGKYTQIKNVKTFRECFKIDIFYYLCKKFYYARYTM